MIHVPLAPSVKRPIISSPNRKQLSLYYTTHNNRDELFSCIHASITSLSFFTASTHTHTRPRRHIIFSSSANNKKRELSFKLAEEFGVYSQCTQVPFERERERKNIGRAVCGGRDDEKFDVGDLHPQRKITKKKNRTATAACCIDIKWNSTTSERHDAFIVESLFFTSSSSSLPRCYCYWNHDDVKRRRRRRRTDRIYTKFLTLCYVYFFSIFKTLKNS